MILMKLKLDNYMAFNDFQMSMTYAKKVHDLCKKNRWKPDD